MWSRFGATGNAPHLPKLFLGRGKGRECVMHRIGRLSVRRVSDSRIDSSYWPFAVRDNLYRRTYPLHSTPPVQHGYIPVGVQVVPICPSQPRRETGEGGVRFEPTTPSGRHFSTHPSKLSMAQTGLEMETYSVPLVLLALLCSA